MGIKQSIQSAETIEEIQALQAELATFKFASPNTVRACARAAAIRTEQLWAAAE